MNTKEKLKTVISDMRADIQCDCFCKLAIKGGYELFFRDMLYERLFYNYEEINTEVAYEITIDNKSKSNYLDLAVGSKENLDFLIELGHNGTWQPAFNVINHAINDINRSFEFQIQSKERYTISLLTHIESFKDNQKFRLRKSYLNGISRNVDKHDKKVDDVKRFLRVMDKDFHESIFKLEWNGFKVTIHVFLCGPFESTISKEMVRNVDSH